jgi:hypothetical protein
MVIGLDYLSGVSRGMRDSDVCGHTQRWTLFAKGVPRHAFPETRRQSNESRSVARSIGVGRRKLVVCGSIAR